MILVNTKFLQKTLNNLKTFDTGDRKFKGIGATPKEQCIRNWTSKTSTTPKTMIRSLNFHKNIKYLANGASTGKNVVLEITNGKYVALCGSTLFRRKHSEMGKAQ